jgi:hypothetical protein
MAEKTTRQITRRPLPQIEKLKIWKYIILHITTMENVIGKVISGNF